MVSRIPMRTELVKKCPYISDKIWLFWNRTLLKQCDLLVSSKEAVRFSINFFTLRAVRTWEVLST